MTARKGKAKATKVIKKTKRVAKTAAEKKQITKDKRAAEAREVALLGPASPYWRGWLRSTMRQAFRKWPSYRELVYNTETRMLQAVDKRGGRRIMKHKQCANCAGWFKLRDLAQDHIIPVGSLLSTTPEEVGRFVLNLFCSVQNMRYLCDYTLDDAKTRFGGRKSCHYHTTYGEK
jgi:hypothetical protein